MTRTCFAIALLLLCARAPHRADAQEAPVAGPTLVPAQAPSEPAPPPPPVTPDEPAANDPLALDPAPAGPSSLSPAPVAPVQNPGAPVAFIGDGGAFMPQRRGISWDLHLEGGLGVALRNDLPDTFFGRARAGLLIMHEPYLYAFGPSIEVGGLTGLGFGGQLDAIHLTSGMSLELGAAFAATDEAVIHASLGYALFAVEWQHRFASDSADALMFKLRIPIGIAYFLISNR